MENLDGRGGAVFHLGNPDGRGGGSTIFGNPGGGGSQNIMPFVRSVDFFFLELPNQHEILVEAHASLKSVDLSEAYLFKEF